VQGRSSTRGSGRSSRKRRGTNSGGAPRTPGWTANDGQRVGMGGAPLNDTRARMVRRRTSRRGTAREREPRGGSELGIGREKSSAAQFIEKGEGEREPGRGRNGHGFRAIDGMYQWGRNGRVNARKNGRGLGALVSWQ
jgi:hypothetical protein